MISPTKLKLIANFLLFQVGWFICVTAPQSYGVAFTVVALALHFSFIGSKQELPLFAAMITVGFISDSALQFLNIMAFKEAVLWQPPWLLCLWALFATTLNHSLAWLLDKPVILITSGAVMGPVSYIIGSKLGAASIQIPLLYLFILLAALWALIMYGVYKHYAFKHSSPAL